MSQQPATPGAARLSPTSLFRGLHVTPPPGTRVGAPAPAAGVSHSVAALFAAHSASSAPNLQPQPQPASTPKKRTTKQQRAKKADPCHSAPVTEGGPGRNPLFITSAGTPPSRAPAGSYRRLHSSSTGDAGMPGDGRYLLASGKQRPASVSLTAARSTPPPPPLRFGGQGTVHKADDDGEMPYTFAGSKFSESPSARSLPLPPSQWLEELKAQRSPLPPRRRAPEEQPLHELPEEADTEEALASDDTGCVVLFDLSSANSSPTISSASSSSANGTGGPHAAGLRLHPLQLIAVAKPPQPTFFL